MLYWKMWVRLMPGGYIATGTPFYEWRPSNTTADGW